MSSICSKFERILLSANDSDIHDKMRIEFQFGCFSIFAPRAGSQRVKCLPCPFLSYPGDQEGRLPFPDWRESCERILKWIYIVVVPLGHVVPNERNSGEIRYSSRHQEHATLLS